MENSSIIKITHVLNEHDFVNDDNNTAKEQYNKIPESYSQGEHGTATLSLVGGKV